MDYLEQGAKLDGSNEFQWLQQKLLYEQADVITISATASSIA